MSSHRVSLWVQIYPQRSQWNESVIHSAKIAKITRRRPKTPLPDCRLVKVILDVPDDNFQTQAVEVDVPPPTQIRAVG